MAFSGTGRVIRPTVNRPDVGRRVYHQRYTRQPKRIHQGNASSHSQSPRRISSSESINGRTNAVLPASFGSVAVLPVNQEFETQTSTTHSTLHEILNTYFNDLEDREKLLEGIDQIWRDENLFFEVNSQAYGRYSGILLEIIEANKEHFDRLRLNGQKSTTFEHEFKILHNNHALGPGSQTKIICLTQALELALMGVNPTAVLKSINRQLNPDPENTRGQRQELAVDWFLTKFYVPTLPNNQRYHVNLSERVTTKKDTHGTQDSEIDAVIHPYALISVKHHIPDEIQMEKRREVDYTPHGREIINLFLAISSSGKFPKDRIQKLIVVSGSSEIERWSRNFWTDDGYKKRKTGAIQYAQRILSRRELNGSKDAMERLISEDGVEIYYVASVMNNNHVRDWIKLLYGEYQKAA